MDTSQCDPLHKSVLKMFGGLGMQLEEDVAVVLVDASALGKHAEEADVVHGGCGQVPHTRGLTLAEVPEASGKSRNQAGSVSAILILYAMPRLLTGATLAHELMHAWLR